jgi:hypothetical protein
MSNRKPIRKAKFGGEGALLWLGAFRLRRQRRATFSNGSLEHTRDRRLRRRPRRRPAADAEQQHDELPIRTITAGSISSLAYDRSTTSIL